jgi:hypothetical protein
VVTTLALKKKARLNIGPFIFRRSCHYPSLIRVIRSIAVAPHNVTATLTITTVFPILVIAPAAA